MAEPTIDWSTAKVHDAKLTVEIASELPDGWRDTFASTVKLLGGGSWGEVKLKKGRAEISRVTPGSEDKLRHFLEGVVLQANAAHTDDEGEEPRDEAEDHDEGGDEEQRETGPDQEMSERFRSFGDGRRGE